MTTSTTLADYFRQNKTIGIGIIISEHAHGDPYMLCQVGDSILAFIGLESANRFSGAVGVRNVRKVSVFECKKLLHIYQAGHGSGSNESKTLADWFICTREQVFA